jgi:hypothetical protein
MGVCLISYQYGTEKTIKPIKKIDDDDDINKFSSLDPKNYIIDRQFDRMFIDTSVWNNYDTSTINKIYSSLWHLTLQSTPFRTWKPQTSQY